MCMRLAGWTSSRVRHDGGMLCIRDAHDPDQIISVVDANLPSTDLIFTIQFDPTSTMIAAASKAGLVCIWDLERAIILVIIDTGKLDCIELPAGSGELIVALNDSRGGVETWNPIDGERAGERWSKPSNHYDAPRFATAMCISPEGVVASAPSDGSIEL